MVRSATGLAQLSTLRGMVERPFHQSRLPDADRPLTQPFQLSRRIGHGQTFLAGAGIVVSAYLLFAHSLGHRAGAGVVPCGSAFRTRVPRPPGFGLLPPRRLRVSFQKLLLLATRLCRDLGAAHLAPLRDLCPE